MKYKIFRRDENLGKVLNHVAIDLPAPSNISYYWNFGSLLLLVLGSQIGSGLLLAMNYFNSTSTAFGAIDSIGREIWGGWLTRYIHITGASMYFMFLYFHIGRGLYYKSFNLVNTWLTGTTILLLSMASAFLGYVLPWGQMSYWGATVITNFFSVIPYIGPSLVVWIWGSFSVDYPTLCRFFSLHFLLPFVVFVVVGLHVMYLHDTGSNNPLGLASGNDKVIFYPYYLAKDTLGFTLIPLSGFVLFFSFPWVFSEYQNFIEANCLVTPPHIQPEWYFLAAYAVLRAIPSKLGGVIALVAFVAILYLLPFIGRGGCLVSSLTLKSQVVFYGWLVNFFFLTFVGACPVEEPFILLSRVGCVLYFSFFLYFYAPIQQKI